jgi:TRAP transporter TAXI family solute receptor
MKKLISLMSTLTILISAQAISAQSKLPIGEHPNWPKEIRMLGFRGTVDLESPLLARLIEQYVGVRVTFQAIPSDTEKMNMMLRGDALMCHATSTNIAEVNEGQKGLGYYEPGFGKVRSLFVSSVFAPGFLTMDPNIKTVRDFKGKKVMYHNISEITRIDNKCFEYYGLVPNKNFIALPKMDPGEGIQALIEGRTDVVYLGGRKYQTHPSILELASKGKVYFVAFPQECVKFAAQTYHAVYPDFILKEQYKFLSEDVPVWSHKNVYAALAEKEQDLIYYILKAIYDHADQLNGKPGCEFFPSAVASKEATGAPQPYHAGAARYYKEKGWWTAEHEKQRKEALTKVGMPE